MNANLERMLDYDLWANLQVLRSLRDAVGPPPRAMKVMAHIAATYELWLSRIEAGAAVVVWPELDHHLIESSLNTTNVRLVQLARTTDDRTIDYINSMGEQWQSTISEIITHIVIHSGYHRGQIAMIMAADGHAAVYTDYIQATRTGEV